MANLISRLIHMTTFFHINGIYNFIRKKYFDVKTSNHKQTEKKEFVILLLLEIYLREHFQECAVMRKFWLLVGLTKSWILKDVCFNTVPST